MNKPSIQLQLANSLGRRDQVPNISLAQNIAESKNTGDIEQLCDILMHGKTPLKVDAIKVLYEVGARQPELISQYLDIFLKTMVSRNNRIIWGSLTAIAQICKIKPEAVHAHLQTILDAADASSVIAKDQAFEILCQLKTVKSLSSTATPLLFDRLSKAAINQLPMYAEKAASVLDDRDKAEFREILAGRLDDHMVQSKRKRLEKILKYL